ncbi:MAG: CHRD domain-containing protein [Alphaproteobacteria bacterium]|nr:CHRD domain-containing protein [Alphaproteobacteria bacterium]
MHNALKFAGTVSAIAAIALIGAPASAATMAMKATLNAGSEVPPNQSRGTGTATVTLDNTTRQLTWNLQYSGLTGPATAAHFHCPADPGANAGVAVPITGSLASPVQGSATVTEAQMNDLMNGKCYINIHTDQNKAGEIRGQVVRAQ